MDTFSTEAHGSTTKGPYAGPGGMDWLLAFVCTVLIGLQFRFFMQAGMPQTALGYYWQEPGVPYFHLTALILDVAIIAATAWWIFRPALRRRFELITTWCAALGFAVVWGELVRASLPADRIYLLTEMPFQSVNNNGLFGSTVFAAYIVYKLPRGDRAWWLDFVLKSVLILGLYLVQLMLFNAFWQGGTA